MSETEAAKKVGREKVEDLLEEAQEGGRDQNLRFFTNVYSFLDKVKEVNCRQLKLETLQRIEKDPKKVEVLEKVLTKSGFERGEVAGKGVLKFLPSEANFEKVEQHKAVVLRFRDRHLDPEQIEFSDIVEILKRQGEPPNIVKGVEDRVEGALDWQALPASAPSVKPWMKANLTQEGD